MYFFDIDWQGSEQLSKFKELNLVKVFILPPSKEELEKRLIARNQDDKESIKKRILHILKILNMQKIMIMFSLMTMLKIVLMNF